VAEAGARTYEDEVEAGGEGGAGDAADAVERLGDGVAEVVDGGNAVPLPQQPQHCVRADEPRAARHQHAPARPPAAVAVGLRVPAARHIPPTDLSRRSLARAQPSGQVPVPCGSVAALFAPAALCCPGPGREPASQPAGIIYRFDAVGARAGARTRPAQRDRHVNRAGGYAVWARAHRSHGMSSQLLLFSARPVTHVAIGDRRLISSRPSDAG
jgi:hypothetical protein